jgi:hypothetical protein
VRDDRSPAATDRFVGAGLLGMPVRVDQRVNAAGSVALLTAASRASALAARPPSIIKAPSGPRIATTLQPAPWKSVTPSEIRRRDSRSALLCAGVGWYQRAAERRSTGMKEASSGKYEHGLATRPPSDSATS